MATNFDDIDYETDGVEMAADAADTAVAAYVKAARDWWSGAEPSSAVLEAACEKVVDCVNKMTNSISELDQVLVVEKRRRLRRAKEST